MALGSARTWTGLLFVGLNAENLGRKLGPWDGRVTSEIVSLSVVEETHLLPGHSNLTEALETHSASYKVLDVFETVELFEHSGVSVWVTDEVVRGSEVVWLGRGPVVSTA